MLFGCNTSCFVLGFNFASLIKQLGTYEAGCQLIKWFKNPCGTFE